MHLKKIRKIIPQITAVAMAAAISTTPVMAANDTITPDVKTESVDKGGTNTTDEPEIDDAETDGITADGKTTETPAVTTTDSNNENAEKTDKADDMDDTSSSQDSNGNDTNSKDTDDKEKDDDSESETPKVAGSANVTLKTTSGTINSGNSLNYTMDITHAGDEAFKNGTELYFEFPSEYKAQSVNAGTWTGYDGKFTVIVNKDTDEEMSAECAPGKDVPLKTLFPSLSSDSIDITDITIRMDSEVSTDAVAKDIGVIGEISKDAPTGTINAFITYSADGEELAFESPENAIKGQNVIIDAGIVETDKESVSYGDTDGKNTVDITYSGLVAAANDDGDIYIKAEVPDRLLIDTIKIPEMTGVKKVTVITSKTNADGKEEKVTAEVKQGETYNTSAETGAEYTILLETNSKEVGFKDEDKGIVFSARNTVNSDGEEDVGVKITVMFSDGKTEEENVTTSLTFVKAEEDNTDPETPGDDTPGEGSGGTSTDTPSGPSEGGGTGTDTPTPGDTEPTVTPAPTEGQGGSGSEGSGSSGTNIPPKTDTEATPSTTDTDTPGNSGSGGTATIITPSTNRSSAAEALLEKIAEMSEERDRNTAQSQSSAVLNAQDSDTSISNEMRNTATSSRVQSSTIADVAENTAPATGNGTTSTPTSSTPAVQAPDNTTTGNTGNTGTSSSESKANTSSPSSTESVVNEKKEKGTATTTTQGQIPTIIDKDKKSGLPASAIAGIAAGVAAVGGGFFLFFKRKKKDDETKPE